MAQEPVELEQGAESTPLFRAFARIHPWSLFGLVALFVHPWYRMWLQVRPGCIEVHRVKPRNGSPGPIITVEGLGLPLPGAGGLCRVDLQGHDVFVFASDRRAQAANDILGGEPLESLSIDGALASWLYVGLGLATLAMGVTEFSVGVIDRMLGGLALLAIGTIAVAAAAALAIPPWAPEWRRALALMGGAALYGVGTYMGVIALVFAPRRALYGMVWLVVTTIAVRLIPYETTETPDPTDKRSRRARSARSVGSLLVSGGVSLGLVWTIVEFAFTQWSAQPVGTVLNVAGALERAPEGDTPTDLAYRATIDVANRTGSRVELVDSRLCCAHRRVGPTAAVTASFHPRHHR
jgi:hypothetical protein